MTRNGRRKSAHPAFNDVLVVALLVFSVGAVLVGVLSTECTCQV